MNSCSNPSENFSHYKFWISLEVSGHSFWETHTLFKMPFLTGNYIDLWSFFLERTSSKHSISMYFLKSCSIPFRSFEKYAPFVEIGKIVIRIQIVPWCCSNFWKVHVFFKRIGLIRNVVSCEEVCLDLARFNIKVLHVFVWVFLISNCKIASSICCMCPLGVLTSMNEAWNGWRCKTHIWNERLLWIWDGIVYLQLLLKHHFLAEFLGKIKHNVQDSLATLAELYVERLSPIWFPSFYFNARVPWNMCRR